MTLLYISSFFLGCGGAIGIKYTGKHLGLIDTPNHRSSHSSPTPKGGGLGILLAFIIASTQTGLSPAFFLPICLISLLGLLGDSKELSAKLRLAIQCLAALIIVVYSSWNAISLPVVLLLPLWLIFIVGTTNFYNFMDGINGIAGISGAVAFGLLAIFIHIHSADTLYFPITISLVCACLGFLPLNFPIARVFMGDVGSTLLGFIFGILVFSLSQTLLDFICCAAFLFPFYIDELCTIFVRLKNGENLVRAHRKHVYQILVNEKGIAHWKISMTYGFLQLIVGIGIMNFRSYGLITVSAFLFFLSCIFFALSSYIRKHS